MFHYIEKILNVPYRYDKEFKGKLIINGKFVEKTFIHFVFDHNEPNNFPNFEKFDKKAKKLGLAKIANIGKGQIVYISAKDTFELIKKEIKIQPNFLINGAKT